VDLSRCRGCWAGHKIYKSLPAKSLTGRKKRLIHSGFEGSIEFAERAPAQFRDRYLSSDSFQHDADLLLGGELATSHLVVRRISRRAASRARAEELPSALTGSSL
jgi:hypothetical protein